MRHHISTLSVNSLHSPPFLTSGKSNLVQNVPKLELGTENKAQCPRVSGSSNKSLDQMNGLAVGSKPRINFH